MKKRPIFVGAGLALALVAAGVTVSDSVSEQALKRHEVLATMCAPGPVVVEGGDYFFHGRITSVGQIAAEAQCFLAISVPTRILALDESADCTSPRGVDRIKGNGILIGQCIEGTILTRPALASIQHQTVTTIWAEISSGIARAHYADAPGFLCAGGYIARGQAQFVKDRPSAEWELRSIFGQDFPWIQKGMQLRENNRPISDCDTKPPAPFV